MKKQKLKIFILWFVIIQIISIFAADYGRCSLECGSVPTWRELKWKGIFYMTHNCCPREVMGVVVGAECLDCYNDSGEIICWHSFCKSYWDG